MRCLSYIYLIAVWVLLPSPSTCAEAQRFLFNPDTSQISAKIRDPFGNIVNGKLRLRQGEARGDLNRLSESASVKLVLEAGSYNSNIGLRDQDVQEYYLEVKDYPVIRFNSTGLLKVQRPQSSEMPWQIILKGWLELHGVQREIIVPIRLFYQTNKIIAQGSFQLLLQEFNIAVPKLLFLKAGNRVDVEFRIVGEHQP